MPKNIAILDPHKANADVIPHGDPRVIKVNALRTAKAIAAANNGQEPRKIRFHPLVFGRAAILGGFFFFSILIVNHVTKPKIIIDNTQAPPYPRPVEVAKEIGPKAAKS